MLKSVRIPFLSGVSLLVLTTACQKDTEMPAPTVTPPVQEANVSLTYTYSTASANRGQTFLAQEPTGKLASDKLTLTFEKAPRAVGMLTEERIGFVLPRSKQKTGLVGSYTLASQPDPGQGEVVATYERPTFSTGVYLNQYSGNSHPMEGSLVITKYDAGRQLISGSFTFTVKQAKDPYIYLAISSSSDGRSNCEIKGYGSFEEIPLL